jgi:hypothetical protein
MRLLPRNPHQVATVGSLLIDRTPEPTTTSTDVRSVAHRNPFTFINQEKKETLRIYVIAPQLASRAMVESFQPKTCSTAP